MDTISTQGWDTVFALTLAEVNAQLARAVVDTSARLPDVNWTSGNVATLKASFGTWSISSRGHEQSGGTLVTMLFPVTKGIFTYNSQSQQLDGIRLEASVELTSIADDPQHKLVVDVTRPITVTAIDSTPPQPNESTLKLAFNYALKDALASLKYAFAKVDPSQELKDSMPWLAPAPGGVGYCFMGGSSDADSYFGSLCMTDGFIAGNPLPPASMSANLIPTSASAALLMSKQLLFRHVLLPGIIKDFNAQSFDLASGDTTIVMQSGANPILVNTVDVDLSILYAVLSGAALLSLPVTALGLAAAAVAEAATHGGSAKIDGTMQIYLEGLTVTEQAGQIVFDSTLRCELATASPLPAISVATVRLTATSYFELVMQADGKVLFQRAGEPTHSTPEVDAPAWVSTASPVMEGILGLVGTVLTVVTDGVAAVLAGVIFGLLQVAFQFLPQVVQRQLQSGVGQTAPAGLEQLVTVAVSPITWTNKTFKPTAVALNGDLLFTGIFVS
jgi:hypothetical protein